jgi:hypothetical protein
LIDLARLVAEIRQRDPMKTLLKATFNDWYEDRARRMGEALSLGSASDLKSRRGQIVELPYLKK